HRLAGPPGRGSAADGEGERGVDPHREAGCRGAPADPGLLRGAGAGAGRRRWPRPVRVACGRAQARRAAVAGDTIRDSPSQQQLARRIAYGVPPSSQAGRVPAFALEPRALRFGAGETSALADGIDTSEFGNGLTS